MAAVTQQPAAPGFWLARRDSREPVAEWALRMAAGYAAENPAALARLALADVIDDQAQSPCRPEHPGHHSNSSNGGTR
jgi:hypothetical protein